MISDQRRMLLALILIIGVLAMHALVQLGHAPATGHIGDATAAGPAATATDHTEAHSGARAPAASDDTMAGSMEMAPAVHAGPAVPGNGEGHGPMPATLHQVAHLCVAIMASLLVLGVAVLALGPLPRLERCGPSIGALAIAAAAVTLTGCGDSGAPATTGAPSAPLGGGVRHAQRRRRRLRPGHDPAPPPGRGYGRTGRRARRQRGSPAVGRPESSGPRVPRSRRCAGSSPRGVCPRTPAVACPA